jgi:putative ATPase
LDYSKGYKYAHDYEGAFAELEFLPAGMEGTKFYEPNLQNTTEQRFSERITKLWKGKY